MGLAQIALKTLCLLPLASFAEEPSSMRALYMMQTQSAEEAITRYQEYTSKTGRHDFEALQRMGLVLLRGGILSEDPHVFTMTLFGAGLSGSSGALEILEKGLRHPDPQIQMIALHFIARIEDDWTESLLNSAMSSDYLSTRMEAAFYMAQRKHPHAVGQIEGLMHRLPPFFRPYFPSLFALIGNGDATNSLRRLADDLDPQVRVESILNIARLGRDDLLPILRKHLTHNNIAEVEACAFAMGALKDSSSLRLLRRLASSPAPNIQIAAVIALNELGERAHIPILEELARAHNLHAIAALGQLPDTEEVLAELAPSIDLQIRLNAAVSLLMRRDARCLPGLQEILVADARDLAFHPFPSLGRTIAIWKAVPSAELRSKDQSIDLSLSLSMREQLLRESIQLPQEDFLKLARHLFEKRQSDLIPTLISLLENLRTDEALVVLNEGAAKLDSPIIRDYCHLALFRLKAEGPHEEYIKHWVMHQKEADLIRLRPMLPWKMRLESNFTLNPDETSRLLVDSFIALATARNIDFLLEAIKLGNPQNRYALFGLLMRATE